MSTRWSLGANGRLAPEHVKALNMIEIEFHGKKSSKPIIEAWRSYLDHLNNNAPASEAQWAVWNSKREDFMVALLHAMGRALGYTFDPTSIRRTTYAPQGYADVELDSFMMRKALVEILHGRKALHITAAAPSDGDTEANIRPVDKNPLNTLGPGTEAVNK